MAVSRRRGYHAGEDESLRAAVKGAGDEWVLKVGDADDGGYAGEVGGAADVLYRFKAEAAVFGVNKGPVKSGGCEEAGDLGGTELSEVGAELQLAGFQGLFDGVGVHDL